MRFKITFRTEDKSLRNIIPLSYQYELSAWIYSIIQSGNPLFARWLHEKGYILNGKSFKLFTFSRLQIPRNQFQISEDRLIVKRGDVAFYISFLLENAAEPFIMGLFRNQEMILGDRISKAAFMVNTVERLSDPIFKDTMSFSTLSPIVINKFDGKNGIFLKPDHPEYENLFFQNMVRKYVAMTVIHGDNKDPDTSDSAITRFELLNEPKSKLVVIKAGTAQETKIRGYMFEFKLTAPATLIRTGYYAGFGEKNSLGFGCVDIIPDLPGFKNLKDLE
jgi:CRISPR-associated endoribonuclease Cas6